MLNCLILALKALKVFITRIVVSLLILTDVSWGEPSPQRESISQCKIKDGFFEV